MNLGVVGTEFSGAFMYELEHHKAVDLGRGLFFVNYKSAEDTTAPPKVTLSAAEGHERTIEFILHPDATEPTLWEPNSGVVVRVNSRARLQVQVLPTRAGGSRAATVSIEPIESGQLAPSTRRLEQNNGARGALNTDAFKLLGHVAGIGDVAVGPNTWIAGPAAPSRIEGLALQWPDKPADLDIRYAVQLANAQPGSSKMVPLGTFAGTRGRALPLIGVVLEMGGNSRAPICRRGDLLERAHASRGRTARYPVGPNQPRAFGRAPDRGGTDCELRRGGRDLAACGAARARWLGTGSRFPQQAAPGSRKQLVAPVHAATSRGSSNANRQGRRSYGAPRRRPSSHA